MDKVNLYPGMQVEAIENEVKTHLDKFGLAALKTPKVMNQHDSWYSVRYLGTMKSPQRLAELINEYSQGLNVVGQLIPPFAVELADGKKIYLAYLAFAPASARIIDKLMETDRIAGFTPEGGIPNG